MSIKVFVYGTLKKGFGNHRLLKDSKFLGEDLLEATIYSLGPYPAIHLGGSAVHGEVYEVDEGTLARLDRLESHPDYYHRDKAVTSDGVEVEVYTMSEQYLKARYKPIENGIWERNQWNGEDV